MMRFCRSAKALGLQISDKLLAIANEVIEWECVLLRCMSPELADSGTR